MSSNYERFQPESFEDYMARGRTSQEVARGFTRPAFIDPRLAREAELRRQPLVEELARWNATTRIGRQTVCERSETATKPNEA